MSPRVHHRDQYGASRRAGLEDRTPRVPATRLHPCDRALREKRLAPRRDPGVRGVSLRRQERGGARVSTWYIVGVGQQGVLLWCYCTVL